MRTTVRIPENAHYGAHSKTVQVKQFETGNSGGGQSL